MRKAGSVRDDTLLVTDNGATRRVDEVLATATRLQRRRDSAHDPRCVRCNAQLARESSWCPDCKHSTRDFVHAKLATPGARLVGWFLDSVVPPYFGITVGFKSVVLASNHAVTALTVAYAIWACVMYSRGTTPGKNLLAMDVLDESGDPVGFWRMIVREWIAKPISGLVLGLGYYAIIGDDEHRGWHDHLCGTYVVERVDDD